MRCICKVDKLSAGVSTEARRLRLLARRVLENASDGLFDVRSIGVHTSVNARLRVERLIGTDSRTIPGSSSNRRTFFTDKATLFANTVYV